MPAPSASPPSTRERRAALLGLAAVLGTALLLQLAIWDRWIGLLDEGFVLQTATEILRGKVLYRDVIIPAPFPAAFYLLAAVFRLFGATLEVSRVVAVVMFTAMAACVHRLARAVMGPAPALAAGLLFVAYRMWAFPHWHMVSYSTFAIFFATLAVTLLVSGLPAPGRSRLVATGLLGGLSLLCKQDSGLTSLAALATAVLLFPARAGRTAGFVAFTAGAAAVCLPAVAYFTAAGALPDIWAQTVAMPLRWARTFPYPGLPALQPFFLQDPTFRAQAFGYFPGILFTLYWPNINTSWLYRSTPFWEISLKIVYYMPISVAVAAAIAVRHRRRQLEPVRLASRVVLLLFATAFLLAFNKPRDWIHLMVLFMPTLLLALMLASDLASILPRALRRAGAAVAWLGVAAALGLAAKLAVDLRAFTPETLALPGGTVRVTEDEAQVLTEIARYVDANLPPGAPLPVLPYQPLISFLLGRDAGVSDYVIWPVSPYPDLNQRLIRDLEHARVETIIYSISQYAGNLRSFQENAPALFAYLVDHYEMVKTFSMRPWGLVLTALRRRDPAAPDVVARLDERLAEAPITTARDGVATTDPTARAYAAAWPFRRVVVEQPTVAPGASVLRVAVDVPPQARLRVGYGMNPDRWIMAVDRSALTFAIDVETVAGETVHGLEARIDPHRRPEDRHWWNADLDLAPYAGQQVTLAFRVSAENALGTLPDIAGWSDPRLVVSRADSPRARDREEPVVAPGPARHPEEAAEREVHRP